MVVCRNVIRKTLRLQIEEENEDIKKYYKNVNANFLREKILPEFYPFLFADPNMDYDLDIFFTCSIDEFKKKNNEPTPMSRKKWFEKYLRAFKELSMAYNVEIPIRHSFNVLHYLQCYVIAYLAKDGGIYEPPVSVSENSDVNAADTNSDERLHSIYGNSNITHQVVWNRAQDLWDLTRDSQYAPAIGFHHDPHEPPTPEEPVYPTAIPLLDGTGLEVPIDRMPFQPEPEAVARERARDVNWMPPQSIWHSVYSRRWWQEDIPEDILASGLEFRVKSVRARNGKVQTDEMYLSCTPGNQVEPALVVGELEPAAAVLVNAIQDDDDDDDDDEELGLVPLEPEVDYILQNWQWDEDDDDDDWIGVEETDLKNWFIPEFLFQDGENGKVDPFEMLSVEDSVSGMYMLTHWYLLYTHRMDVFCVRHPLPNFHDQHLAAPLRHGPIYRKYMPIIEEFIQKPRVIRDHISKSDKLIPRAPPIFTDLSKLCKNYLDEKRLLDFVGTLCFILETVYHNLINDETRSNYTALMASKLSKLSKHLPPEIASFLTYKQF